MRPGVPFTLFAIALAATTAVVVFVTATEAQQAVSQFVTVAFVLYVAILLIGSRRWIGVASLPMLLSAGIEAGFGDNPSWIRSVVIGCLWFSTIEAGWEALDRRSGATYTAAASIRRAQEVFTVIGLAMAIGLAATMAASLAPVRSVLLQAIVIGSLLISFVLLVRHLAPDRPDGRGAEY